ncbi:hypothetical protein [Paenibacillus rubinfantis]|uniref:hypothetical protein n=1 Tax=Paenibacillus rubinfantis TaxID=1720296 RepID=UPI00073FA487|nr:hypothetical protein [Paenibacillus rubinfantis]
MEEMKSLQVLDRFRGLFEKMGVDYPVMRRIVQVKLAMDARRVPTLTKGSNKRQKEDAGDSNQFLRSLWLYVIFGGLSSMFVLMGDHLLFQMSLLFGIMMFMVMTSMISDFSSVLLDVRDRSILATKPINRRTITMAKTVHIFIYLFFLTGAIAVIPLAVGLFRQGIGFFALMLLELILMDLLIVVLTALLYLVVLRFFDGEKLKDMINYVQIGMTITIAVGYQVLVRLFDFTAMDIAFKPAWWQYLLPPVWVGASFQTLLHPGEGLTYAGLAALSIVVPLAAFLLYLKLMPALERNLQKLAEPSVKGGQGSGKALRRISDWLCSTPQERAFFRFAWTIIGTEREFKLKVYPSLGFSIVFPFIFLFSNGLDQGLDGISGSRSYLFIYASGIMLPTLIMMLRYSSRYKAAWIYRTAPISGEAPIYKGVLLASLVRLMLPLYGVEAAIFAVLFGASIIPDLIVAGLAMQAYALICFLGLRKGLPFSEPFEAAGQQNQTFVIMGLMLLLGGFGLLHWLATTLPFGIVAYGILLIAGTWLAWRLAFRTRGTRKEETPDGL